MNLYAVRKRRGLWSVCSEETVVLNFNSYEEAVGTAQSAAEVLITCSERAVATGGNVPSCHYAPDACRALTLDQLV